MDVNKSADFVTFAPFLMYNKKDVCPPDLNVNVDIINITIKEESFTTEITIFCNNGLIRIRIVNLFRGAIPMNIDFNGIN